MERTETLTFREYTETDKAGILDLWKEESGWGEITMQQFDKWFFNTPYGDCIIVVAVNEANKIIGQIVYSPTRMIVDGKELRTLRVSAPILSKHHQQGNLKSYDHPAFAMMREGFLIAHKAGYQYTYGFPAFGWLGLLRLFPVFLPNPSDTASFECFAISLGDNQTFVLLEETYKIHTAGNLNEEYNELWKDAVDAMPVTCGIVREAKWLQWGVGGHIKLELRTAVENKLVGYMAIKKDTGLITDVFARNLSDLEKVFRYAINALHQQNDKGLSVPFDHLKGMLTTVTTPIVERIGFTKDKYRFAFGSYLLDTTVPFDKIKVDQWYMTPLG